VASDLATARERASRVITRLKGRPGKAGIPPEVGWFLELRSLAIQAGTQGRNAPGKRDSYPSKKK